MWLKPRTAQSRQPCVYSTAALGHFRPHIDVLEPIAKTFGTGDYVRDPYLCTKFGENLYTACGRMCAI